MVLRWNLLLYISIVVFSSLLNCQKTSAGESQTMEMMVPALRFTGEGRQVSESFRSAFEVAKPQDDQLILQLQFPAEKAAEVFSKSDHELQVFRTPKRKPRVIPCPKGSPKNSYEVDVVTLDGSVDSAKDDIVKFLATNLEHDQVDLSIINLSGTNLANNGLGISLAQPGDHNLNNPSQPEIIPAVCK